MTASFCIFPKHIRRLYLTIDLSDQELLERRKEALALLAKKTILWLSVIVPENHPKLSHEEDLKLFALSLCKDPRDIRMDPLRHDDCASVIIAGKEHWTYTKPILRPRQNEDIRFPFLTVLNPDKSPRGILTWAEALCAATAEHLDLVEIRRGTLPLCWLTDYGLYRYEQKRRAKRRHRQPPKLKEIRLRPQTSNNDRDTKVASARRFLLRGQPVVFRMLFRGREFHSATEAHKAFHRIALALEDCSEIVSMPALKGYSMVMKLKAKTR